MIRARAALVYRQLAGRCRVDPGLARIADARLISPVYLPGPDRAWDALVFNLRNGSLQPKILGTVGRMLSGWLLASLAGVAVGR